MKQLKSLGLTFILMSVLAATVFAGEVQSPPCVPGETNAPPCTSQSATDDTTGLSESLTPAASDTVDIVDLAEAVGWALSLF